MDAFIREGRTQEAVKLVWFFRFFSFFFFFELDEIQRNSVTQW